MICKKCGTFNEEGTNFCRNCGYNMVEVQEAVQPEITAQQEPVVEQTYQPEAAPENVIPTGYTQNPEPVKQPGMGLAIAGMICGILSFLCLWYITGPLGIVFGIIAKSKGCKSGMATAGIVCGAIGTVLSLVLIVIMLIVGGTYSGLTGFAGGF